MHLELSDIEISSSDTQIVTPHDHDFFEIMYVAKGAATHNLNGTTAQLKKGQFLIMDYNTVHFYSALNNQREKLSVINILFRAKLIDKSLSYCKDLQTFLQHYLIQIDFKSFRINPLKLVYSDIDGSFLYLLNTMKKEYEEQQPGYIEVMRSALIWFLIKMMRHIPQKETGGDIIDFMLKAVKKNYITPPLLSEIADKFNYSIPYLSAKFKTCVGKSYREYIIEQKMQEAFRLLTNTDKKIYEIANSVGYTDINFFYEIFHKYAGVSPNVYRNLNK